MSELTDLEIAADINRHFDATLKAMAEHPYDAGGLPEEPLRFMRRQQLVGVTQLGDTVGGVAIAHWKEIPFNQDSAPEVQRQLAGRGLAEVVITELKKQRGPGLTLAVARPDVRAVTHLGFAAEPGFVGDGPVYLIRRPATSSLWFAAHILFGVGQ